MSAYFNDALKRAIKAKDHKNVQALICLLPELAGFENTELLEDYLVDLVKSTTAANYDNHLNLFKSIWYYGAHHMHQDDDKWAFLYAEPQFGRLASQQSTSSSRPESLTDLDPDFAQGFKDAMEGKNRQVLPEAQGLKLRLPADVNKKLATMLGALTGHTVSFSERSFRAVTDPINGTKITESGPHFRIVCTAEQCLSVLPRLEIFNIPYYQDFYKESPSKGSMPVITIAQSSLKQVHRIFENPFQAKSDLSFKTAFPADMDETLRDAKAALYFDFIFNTDKMLADLLRRAASLLPAPQGLAASQSSIDSSEIGGSLSDNLTTYLTAWMDQHAENLVPMFMDPISPSDNDKNVLQTIAKKHRLPWVECKSTPDSLGDKPLDLFRGIQPAQKWSLLELCFLPERFLERFVASAAENPAYKTEEMRTDAKKRREAFVSHIQDTLSTYVPEGIRQRKAPTDAQPIDWLHSSDYTARPASQPESQERDGTLSLRITR